MFLFQNLYMNEVEQTGVWCEAKEDNPTVRVWVDPAPEGMYPEPKVSCLNIEEMTILAEAKITNNGHSEYKICKWALHLEHYASVRELTAQILDFRIAIANFTSCSQVFQHRAIDSCVSELAKFNHCIYLYDLKKEKEKVARRIAEAAAAAAAVAAASLSSGSSATSTSSTSTATAASNASTASTTENSIWSNISKFQSSQDETEEEEAMEEEEEEKSLE